MGMSGSHGFALVIILGVYCTIGLVGIAGTIFWIWMLVDCLKHESAESNDKTVWILVILLTHFIGAALYFFMKRRPRISQNRPVNFQ